MICELDDANGELMLQFIEGGNSNWNLEMRINVRKRVRTRTGHNQYTLKEHEKRWMWELDRVRGQMGEPKDTKDEIKKINLSKIYQINF